MLRHLSKALTRSFRKEKNQKAAEEKRINNKRRGAPQPPKKKDGTPCTSAAE